MKWNIFNSVSALEQKVKDLTDFSGDHSRWIARLEEKVHMLETSNSVLIKMNEIKEKKLKDLNNAIFVHSRLLNLTYSEVPPVPNSEDEKLLKKRQYQREWAAKMRVKKMEKAKAQSQREKKNAYARAYYLRTKGKKQ